MIRSGTRIVDEDGNHGTVLSITNGEARVDYDQSETYGRCTRTVDIDCLYREDESNEPSGITG